jgi:hypothetical protein
MCSRLGRNRRRGRACLYISTKPLGWRDLDGEWGNTIIRVRSRNRQVQYSDLYPRTVFVAAGHRGR